MLNIILPIVTALIAAGGTYLIARRKTSGDIETSEAAQLWAESQAMRKELRDEVVELRDQISTMQKYVGELQKERYIDKSKISRLQEKVKALEKRVKELEARL